MTSVFEKYFEDETFETDVFLIRSETYDYGDDPVEVYRNPDNPEDVGCYSQFGAMIDEHGQVISWHRKPVLYWPEEVGRFGLVNERRYDTLVTYRMVVSRAKKKVPKEFKNTYCIRESKGIVADNPLLVSTTERYKGKHAEMESPIGTFRFNPWVEKFVLELEEPKEEFYLGPCITVLECDPESPESCKMALDYAMQFYGNYYNWHYRLISRAIPNLLKKEVDWLVTDEQYREMIDNDDGGWMHCTYASRVFDKTWFEELSFDSKGNVTAKLCCSVVDIDGYFTMTASLKTNRVKKLTEW